MYKTTAEAHHFAEELKTMYGETDVRAAICAPFTQLETLVRDFAGTGIGVGAQNVYFEKEGAFTGEISVPMLEEIGVDYCIVGHSERRQYFNETDETVNRKLKALLETKIRPILCVGEVLEQRDAGKEKEVVVCHATISTPKSHSPRIGCPYLNSAAFISYMSYTLFVMKYVMIKSNLLLGENAISALESRSSIVGISSSRAMAKATAVFFFGL